MTTRRVGAFAVAAAMTLITTGCTGQSGGSVGGSASTTPVTDEAGTTGTAAETATGPFLLDLRTGDETPLPESLAGGTTYVPSPDGTRLAYTRYPYDPSGVLEMANLDGTDVRTIEPADGLAISDGARWSPDGTMLVSQEGVDPGALLGNLFVHDLAGGKRTQLTDLDLTNAHWFWISASFSPDGKQVIFHLPRTPSETTKWDAWSVPVAGGEPTLVLRNATFPLYLPDGERIAFVVPRPDNFGEAIAIGSADGTGSSRTLVDAGGEIWWPAPSPDGTRIAYAVGGNRPGDVGSIHVVDVSTGETSEVAEGAQADWVDDRTLLVSR